MESASTDIRGFSYKPLSQREVEQFDLQYIECDELERTWKINRRERTKQREQKIWDEFVKEQDIVSTAYKDDPYQFIDNVPQSALHDILLKRLEQMKETATVVVPQVVEAPQPPETDHVVTFVEETERDDDNIFLIFDDEKEDASDVEDEALECGEGEGACTVRENADAVEPQPDAVPEKSSEINISSVIESSIYCAKVKEIRNKITEEMLAIMSSLEILDIMNIDPSQAIKMRKRAVEFSTRFNRIHLYQLQRQWQDIKRCSAAPMPFAMHTHFQAQMMRAVSLHQNILAALQVFHKSLEQSRALDGGAVLASLVRHAAATCGLSELLPAPRAAAQAALLWPDGIQETCDKLENTIKMYAARVEEYFNINNLTNDKNTKRNKMKGKKMHSSQALTKCGNKSLLDDRLSMYSLKTVRNPSSVRSLHSRDNTSAGTSKATCGIASEDRGKKLAPRQDPSHSKIVKKSPRNRRPLMRGNSSTRLPRPPQQQLSVDSEIHTMVENVPVSNVHATLWNVPCPSSHISLELSPRVTPKLKPNTPRNKAATPRNVTPRIRPKPLNQIISPKLEKPKIKPTVTMDTKTVKHQNSVPTRTDVTSTENLAVFVSPVSKIQFEKKVKEEKRVPSPRGRDSTKLPTSPRYKLSDMAPEHGEVSRLLQQLCGRDTSGSDRVPGAKNVQLLCVKGGSPRQHIPSTPQLLKILEETIQKKAPKPLYQTPPVNNKRFRMALNVPEATCDSLFQYRTKFVQHMLGSALYANFAVRKPWEIVGSISEEIIDELLLNCAKEMQLENVVEHMYKCETS